MPEGAGAAEVADSDDEFRLHPPCVAPAKRGEWESGRRSNGPQLGASLLDRQRSAILAVKKHQVESDEDQSAAAERDSGFHCAEVRPAALIEHNYLAVDHG